MLTVSKAFDMSSATIIERWCGFFLLNPCDIYSCKAVAVECSFLMLCVCIFGMFSVMWGSMIFSKVLAIGDKSDIGL